jgi:hypothetical protein
MLVLAWSSGNEKVDNSIQEMQFEMNDYNDVVFEWIPYNQFGEIKEISKDSSITVCSAKWRDGPLHWNKQNENYIRISSKEVFLKCFHNSQDHFVIKEVLDCYNLI